MLIMRRRAPNMARKFTTPLAWIIGPAGILGCLYLFYSLPWTTQKYFLFAQLVGLAIYFLYGAHRSIAGRKQAL